MKEADVPAAAVLRCAGNSCEPTRRPLRGLAWGIDGVGLVMASALLTIAFYGKGQDLVAAGFLVFAIGQGLILSGAAMELTASVPSFGAGTSLWALALVLISIPRVFPLPVRLLGMGAAALFGATALQIFAGIQLMPTSAPLPFSAYPVLVATLVGWIWTLMTRESGWRPGAQGPEAGSSPGGRGRS